MGMVVLISSLAITFHDQMSTRLFEARAAALDAEALSLARSGVCLARLILKVDVRPYFYLHRKGSSGTPDAATPEQEEQNEDKSSDKTKIDEIYQLLVKTESEGFPLEGGRLAMRLVDENSLININRANEATLTNLFLTVKLKRKKKLELINEEVDEDISQEAAKSIINWRSAESQKLTGGADDAFYQKQTPPYKARSSSFETVDEILLVKDMTPLSFYGRVSKKEKDEDTKTSPAEKDSSMASATTSQKSARDDEKTDKGKPDVTGLASLVTVYGDGKVNVNNAPEQVLKCLPGIMENPTKDTLVKTLVSRRPFRSMGEVQALCSQTTVRTGSSAIGQLKLTSTVVRVRATGFKGRRRKTVEAVLSKSGQDIKTLYYREE